MVGSSGKKTQIGITGLETEGGAYAVHNTSRSSAVSIVGLCPLYGQLMHFCFSCIQALAKFVQPILNGISAHTGFQVTMLAGEPEPADGGRLCKCC